MGPHATWKPRVRFRMTHCSIWLHWNEVAMFDLQWSNMICPYRKRRRSGKMLGPDMASVCARSCGAHKLALAISE